MGWAGDWNERETERKKSHEAKRKEISRERGGGIGIMEYVFRIVEVRY